jgi:hypothetical protein
VGSSEIMSLWRYRVRTSLISIVKPAVKTRPSNRITISGTTLFVKFVSPKMAAAQPDIGQA